MFDKRCAVCGDEITDWGFGDWHHVPSPDEDAYLKGHDHDAVGNTTGWFDNSDVWHDGIALTHTETRTDAGPNYCRECSEAHGHWVRWPCRLVTSGTNAESGDA